MFHRLFLNRRFTFFLGRAWSEAMWINLVPSLSLLPVAFRSRWPVFSSLRSPVNFSPPGSKPRGLRFSIVLLNLWDCRLNSVSSVWNLLLAAINLNTRATACVKSFNQVDHSIILHYAERNPRLQGLPWNISKEKDKGKECIYEQLY